MAKKKEILNHCTMESIFAYVLSRHFSFIRNDITDAKNNQSYFGVNECMYVCMCVCVYVCVYVCMYTLKIVSSKKETLKENAFQFYF